MKWFAITMVVAAMAVGAMSYIPAAETTWRHAELSRDGMDIVIYATANECQKRLGIRSVSVQESPRRVTITARRDDGFRLLRAIGSCKQPLYLQRRTVHLDEPLAGRELLDGGCQQEPRQCKRAPLRQEIGGVECTGACRRALPGSEEPVRPAGVPPA